MSNLVTEWCGSITRIYRMSYSKAWHIYIYLNVYGNYCSQDAGADADTEFTVTQALNAKKWKERFFWGFSLQEMACCSCTADCQSSLVTAAVQNYYLMGTLHSFYTGHSNHYFSKIWPKKLYDLPRGITIGRSQINTDLLDFPRLSTWEYGCPDGGNY